MRIKGYDPERLDRFMEAFNHLRSQGLAFQQKDIAERVQCTRATISHVFAGDTAYLTDIFLKKFNRSFNYPFNILYLTHGQGTLLEAKEEERKDQKVRVDENSYLILLKLRDDEIKLYKQKMYEMQEELRQLRQVLASQKSDATA